MEKNPTTKKKGPQGLRELMNGITEGYAILDIQRPYLYRYLDT